MELTDRSMAFLAAILEHSTDDEVVATSDAVAAVLNSLGGGEGASNANGFLALANVLAPLLNDPGSGVTPDEFLAAFGAAVRASAEALAATAISGTQH